MISGVLCILLVFWCFWLFSCGLCPFVVLFYCHLLLAVVKKPGWGEPTYVFINNFQFFEEWIEEWLKKNKFGRTGLEGGLNGSNMSCLCNNDAELVGHLCFSLWEAMLALLCIQESGPLSSLNVCLQWSDNNMGHFKTLPMFAAWWIWKVRNLFIFEGLVRQPHLHSWLSSLNFFFMDYLSPSHPKKSSTEDWPLSISSDPTLWQRGPSLIEPHRIGGHFSCFWEYYFLNMA